MPTRFNVSAPAQVGQTQLVVMTRQKSLAKLSDYIDDAAAALKEARICLRDVDIALQAGVLSNEVLVPGAISSAPPKPGKCGGALLDSQAQYSRW